MSFIGTLALAMGLSWVSGINLYAGVATLVFWADSRTLIYLATLASSQTGG